MRSSFLLVAVALLISVARADDLSSAAHAPGISVIGVASVQIRPSAIEISASLSADAELANDARVRERDARQRVIDALETKYPGVTLESGGISVNPLVDSSALAMQRQQQIMIQNGVVVQMQQNQTDMNRRIGVTEQVRLVLKDADKLEPSKLVETVLRLIDAARDSGLQFVPFNTSNLSVYSAAPAMPPVPLVVCRASNTPAVREQAYKAAIADARQKASLLADLAGVKVGKIIGIQEVETANGAVQTAQTPGAAGQDAAISSSLIGQLSLSVRLGVQFEIVK